MSPASGVSLTNPNVTIVAAVTGSIARVQFFDARTLLGTATSSPFEIVANLTAGPHALNAQGTDDQGRTVFSSVVPVTVSARIAAAIPTLSETSLGTDGTIQFTANGSAGLTYVVQVSSDLKNWTTVQTMTAPSNIFTVTATPTPGLSRIYRLQVQP